MSIRVRWTSRFPFTFAGWRAHLYIALSSRLTRRIDNHVRAASEDGDAVSRSVKGPLRKEREFPDRSGGDDRAKKKVTRMRFVGSTQHQAERRAVFRVRFVRHWLPPTAERRRRPGPGCEASGWRRPGRCHARLARMLLNGIADQANGQSNFERGARAPWDATLASLAICFEAAGVAFTSCGSRNDYRWRELSNVDCR